MRRREFLGVLGGAAQRGRSQRARSNRRCRLSDCLAARRRGRFPLDCRFHERLREARICRGPKCAIEYRWAEGHTTGCQCWLPIWLVIRWRCIVAMGMAPATCNKAATATIPIVFTIGTTTRSRLGSSPTSAWPGATSLGCYGVERRAWNQSRLEFLHELVPKAQDCCPSSWNPSNPDYCSDNLSDPRNSCGSRGWGLKLHLVLRERRTRN